MIKHATKKWKKSGKTAISNTKWAKVLYLRIFPHFCELDLEATHVIARFFVPRQNHLRDAGVGG